MEKIIFEPPIHTFHIDFMNHVSNIVYIEWMEIGRCRLLETVGLPVPQIMQQGYGPVLVETNIQYKQQLKLGDTVRAEVWISEMNHVSAWMEFRFYGPDQTLAALGRQRGIFIDLQTGRPTRLPDADRQRFQPFIAKN
ncbi:acyl-CoA thioesterase [uncultured Rubinisphaera sp.]|uniref:acyl-CoA thioesterase n=1 Tax=uncultured Rubinisphaera sp. TaxID=1678686 RepID=UPI0030DC6D31|tara:strand:- start:985 stop:1398 length:414 start_codon:yes stop_codon:yes gene_type:complete